MPAREKMKKQVEAQPKDPTQRDQTPEGRSQDGPRFSAELDLGDPPSFKLFSEIVMLKEVASKYLESVMPAGLNRSLFSVLHALARFGVPRTPSELAAIFEVTRGTMTNTLRRLEERGLIAIEPDSKDRRVKWVSLTERGKQVRDQTINDLSPHLMLLEAEFGSDYFVDLAAKIQQVRLFMEEDGRQASSCG